MGALLRTATIAADLPLSSPAHDFVILLHIFCLTTMFISVFARSAHIISALLGEVREDKIAYKRIAHGMDCKHPLVVVGIQR
jgi:hypothetical protein